MSSRQEDTATEGQWDAYSDYQLVSRGVAKSIRDATRAYAEIVSGIRSGYKIGPQEEAELRADILSAAITLRTELKNEREKREIYDEILSRWEGEEGYISRFRDADLTTQPGEWFEEFVEDIRRAGWELGYLKAGRKEEEENKGDSEDSEVFQLIEEMSL